MSKQYGNREMAEKMAAMAGLDEKGAAEVQYALSALKGTDPVKKALSKMLDRDAAGIHKYACCIKGEWSYDARYATSDQADPYDDDDFRDADHMPLYLGVFEAASEHAAKEAAAGSIGVEWTVIEAHLIG